MRKWIIATAVLLTVPMVGAAAVIVTAPVPEQLVEGHTVFTVIQVRENEEEQREEFAAAVAVLVREITDIDTFYDRFPGVLWFNDQYLVNPSTGPASGTIPVTPRYPCGAVIAVNQGDVVPTDANGVPTVPATATYVESYRITDPNDRAWDVDKWTYDPDGDIITVNSYPMWSVKTTGTNDVKYGQPDDGTACGSAPPDSSSGCGYPILPIHDTTPQRPADYTGPWPTQRSDTYEDSGGNAATGENDQELRRQCLQGNAPPTSSGYPRVEYNAVLFFFLEDLTSFGGVKDHSVASTDSTGCHATPDNLWPCPGGDDNAEGNSHPYNNNHEWPRQLSEGRDNHGGSTGCGEGVIGGGAQDTHATCNIDIYFGYKAAPLPAVRSYPRVFDNEGKTAPYHCHETTVDCNEEEYNPNL